MNTSFCNKILNTNDILKIMRVMNSVKRYSDTLVLPDHVDWIFNLSNRNFRCNHEHVPVSNNKMLMICWRSEFILRMTPNIHLIQWRIVRLIEKIQYTAWNPNRLSRTILLIHKAKWFDFEKNKCLNKYLSNLFLKKLRCLENNW